MSARLLLAGTLAAASLASVPPAHAIVAVVGPRCDYHNGGPYADTNGVGAVTAGPLAPTQNRPVQVTVTCVVQIGSATPYTNEQLRVTQRTLGPAGVLARATTTGPSGDLYVCTSVSWIGLDGTWGSWQADDDLLTPGVQCARATGPAA